MPQTPYTVELELDVPVLKPATADLCRSLGAPIPTGEVDRRKVEAIVLENEYVAATFVPQLGGRLLSLLDKTTSMDCFDGTLHYPENIGAFGFGGLEVSLDGGRRANALGPVRAVETDSGLRMSEIGARGGIDLDVIASVGDGVGLRLEIQFRNRMLHPVPWNPGLLWSDRGWSVDDSGGGIIVYAGELQRGFAIVDHSKGLREVSAEGATCYGELRLLPPRWGNAMLLSIVPVSQLDRVKRVTSVAGLALSDSELILQPRRPVPGAKLVLQTDTGKTLEAPAELTPDKSLRYTFEELGGRPSGFAILDADRAEVFRFPSEDGDPSPLPEPITYPPEPPSDLTLWEQEPAYRYWVANLRTRDAFRSYNFAEAFEQAERALLTNGEDPLTWIEKAIAARHIGTVDDDAPDLPNAYFLAPMEPLLRAEGFLSQPGLAAQSFLAPLADFPDELIEAACKYIDLGLFEDAARFIDAGLTVIDLPMLRYLYAYACLVTGKMKADAASAVASVKLAKPPLPWRPVERVALAELVKSFPGNPILEHFLALSGV